MSVSKILTSVTIPLSVILAIGMMIGLSAKEHAIEADSGSRGTGTSVIVGGDQIQAQNNGSARTLHLNPDGGDVKIGTYGVHGPLAYGRVNPNGSPLSFSSNISATHRHAVGKYDIHIAGGALPSDVLIVTGYNRNAVVDVFIQDGAYHIWTYWLTTEDLSDIGFSFVIYRP